MATLHGASAQLNGSLQKQPRLRAEVSGIGIRYHLCPATAQRESSSAVRYGTTVSWVYRSSRI